MYVALLLKDNVFYQSKASHIKYPAFPARQGGDIKQHTDYNGYQYGLDLCETAQQAGGGWVEYVWLKPGGDVLRALHPHVERRERLGVPFVKPEGQHLSARGKPGGNGLRVGGQFSPAARTNNENPDKFKNFYCLLEFILVT